MKTIFFTFSMMLCLMLTINAVAQKAPDLDKSPVDISYFRAKDKAPLVKVIYGRPQKKGRTVFGELEPYGKVWRTGANEATEIKFYKDATFGGKAVKAGTYTLFSIPEKDQWTIILNSDLDVWGAYSYNQAKDVLRTVVKAKTLTTEVEALAIYFAGNDPSGDLIIAWDKTEVAVPVTFAK